MPKVHITHLNPFICNLQGNPFTLFKSGIFQSIEISDFLFSFHTKNTVFQRDMGPMRRMSALDMVSCFFRQNMYTIQVSSILTCIRNPFFPSLSHSRSVSLHVRPRFYEICTGKLFKIVAIFPLPIYSDVYSHLGIYIFHHAFIHFLRAHPTHTLPTPTT